MRRETSSDILTSNTDSLQRHREHTSAHDAVVTGIQRPRGHASRNDTQHHCNDGQDGEGEGHSQDGPLVGLHDGERRSLCRRRKGIHGRSAGSKVLVESKIGRSRLGNEALYGDTQTRRCSVPRCKSHSVDKHQLTDWLTDWRKTSGEKESTPWQQTSGR